MFKLTYINPGETDENDFLSYETQKEALGDAETEWEDGTEVRIWKLVKKGKASTVINWEN